MARRIGAVRGAADNSYTAGVICAKVSRTPSASITRTG